LKKKNLLHDRRAVSKNGTVILMTLIIFGALIFVGFGVSQGWLFNTPSAPSTPNVPSYTAPPLTSLNYGSFDMKCSGISSLTPTTTYAYSTNYTVDWVSLRNGVAQVLNPGGDGTDTILVDPMDAGYIYAVVKPVDESNIYVDPAAIMSKNTFVVPDSAAYGPIFGNGVNYWYFKYSLNQPLPAPALGVAPTYPFTAYFKAYQTISLNNPSDVTGIGEATVDVPIRWEGSFSTVNHAVAINKVSITLNTTDSTKVTVKSLSIPGFRTLTSLDFAPAVEGASTLRYDFVLSNSLAGAAFSQWTTGTTNVLDFGTTYTCNLAENDAIQATISIFTLDENGKQVAAITDSVVLSEP
jgi:hypothetical protein